MSRSCSAFLIMFVFMVYRGGSHEKRKVPGRAGGMSAMTPFRISGMVRYGMVRHSIIWYDMGWYDMIGHSRVWCCVVWYTRVVYRKWRGAREKRKGHADTFTEHFFDYNDVDGDEIYDGVDGDGDHGVDDGDWSIDL